MSELQRILSRAKAGPAATEGGGAAWTGERLRAFRESLTRRKAPKVKGQGKGPRQSYPSRPEFAAALGVALNTVKRWEAGEYPIPAPVQQLLTQMVRQKRKRV